MTDTAETFRSFVEWAEGSDPLYAHLAHRIAADADPDLLAVAEAAPEDRATANLLFAAVHFLLERSPDHPLAAYYPTLTDDARSPDDDCYPAFRDFCLDHADEVRSLLRRRRTQTNSVRRTAVLYPAIAHVASRVDGPLALVELGPSAGLNLLFDRYRYDYGDRVVGASESPVTIESEVRGGDPPLPTDPPTLHSRVGVDLNPLDVTDDADADWLRALVWPAHEDRRTVLDAALTVARTDPPRLVAGDLLEDLPGVLDEIPEDVPVCVVNTLVLYQVPQAVCAELETYLTGQMARRPLHWLTGETELSGGDSVRLDWVRAEGNGVERTRLADYDPHGAWVDWRA
ncbi:DUF2332 domain-containing protein [Halomicroarcula sp. S1AR25-4]|uniref:DUF2332 domain-containing protein n=1 Tax=Haloarcula sp. S1AR25-4 TaxID=2950538 RepID=UPI00287402FA|nr:DUF2332 domain-containing protein [Halomicroarcula sp. S1AR25-4]MDS0277623.1 DUF2332 domain-containing protein [Halomicroarcula sp. S1AR25-4]